MRIICQQQYNAQDSDRYTREMRIICQQQYDTQGSDRYTRERRMILHVCQLTLEVIVGGML